MFARRILAFLQLAVGRKSKVEEHYRQPEALQATVYCLLMTWQDYYTPDSVNQFLHLKFYFMGNLLYILVVILIIGWLLGMFAFNVSSGLIHALLVIAVILIIIKLVSGRRI